MALLAKIAATLVALYAALYVATLYLQRRLMYFPETERITPASVELGGVEEITLETPDGERVLAWWGRARPGAPTILYFHGNGGSFGVRAERIRKYMARGWGVFMMTYRGFGGSTGTPSEAANVADAKLAYDRLVAGGVDAGDIIVYGESLGTGVAVQVAADKRIGGLILDAPYTSMIDLAALHYSYLPARWLMTDRYETMRFIGEVRAPLLVIHGEADDVIPVAMGRAVHRAARSPKTIVTFPSANHADHHLFGSYDAVYRWVDDLRSRKQRAAG